MLTRGNQLPSFEVETLTGARVRYDTLWQRRNLLLVLLDRDDPGSASYAAAFDPLASALEEYDATPVVTFDRVPGLPTPGVVVADRWGEIYQVAGAPDATALPAPDEVLEALRYVAHECPECQGEAL